MWVSINKSPAFPGRTVLTEQFPGVGKAGQETEVINRAEQEKKQFQLTVNGDFEIRFFFYKTTTLCSNCGVMLHHKGGGGQDFPQWCSRATVTHRVQQVEFWEMLGGITVFGSWEFAAVLLKFLQEWKDWTNKFSTSPTSQMQGSAFPPRAFQSRQSRDSSCTGPTLSILTVSFATFSDFLQSYVGKRILSRVPALFKRQNCNEYKHILLWYHTSPLSPFLVQQQACWLWQYDPANTEIQMEFKHPTG